MIKDLSLRRHLIFMALELMLGFLMNGVGALIIATMNNIFTYFGIAVFLIGLLVIANSN